jgi:hypothetical protein
MYKYRELDEGELKVSWLQINSHEERLKARWGHPREGAHRLAGRGGLAGKMRLRSSAQ